MWAMPAFFNHRKSKFFSPCLTGEHSDQKQEQSELEKAEETELAFQIADRYISIQETEGGYDYFIMGMDYKEIDGGVYDNPDINIRDALNNIIEDLKENPFDNGARGNISDNDKLISIDYDGLMEKVEEANRIVPEIFQGNIVENFKKKTNELFHDICEMNPSEIEDTVKCHVQAKIDDYAIAATIVDVAVSGSRCRGLERNGSDLDCGKRHDKDSHALELSTNEREDNLFNVFNDDDGMYIGDVKVDINPITPQKTGTLESYVGCRFINVCCDSKSKRRFRFDHVCDVQPGISQQINNLLADRCMEKNTPIFFGRGPVHGTALYCREKSEE